MANPFSPPSFYQNYQPPPLRSDWQMPVPGWGWPASSAGPRCVGVGGYGGLGESYDVTLPVYGKGAFDLPTSQIGADAARGALPVLRDELPAIIQSAQSEITFAVVKGAFVAAAIGAVAILGYKYFVRS